MKKETITEEKVEVEEKNIFDQITEKRANFLAKNAKAGSLNSVLFFAIIIIICVAFFVVPTYVTNVGLQKALMIILTVIPLGGILVFTYLQKRNRKAAADAYLKEINELVSNYVFGEESVNALSDLSRNLPLEVFNACKAFKEIAEVRSWNFVEYTKNEKKLEIYDSVAFVKGQKRMERKFIGKYVVADTSYSEAEPIIVYLKGNTKALPPNNLDAYEVAKEDDKFIVYTNNKNWEKVLTQKVMEIINNFKVSELLDDMAISICEGKIYFLMGYDDPIMVLPYTEQHNPSCLESYKNDLEIICDVVEALDK